MFFGKRPQLALVFGGLAMQMMKKDSSGKLLAADVSNMSTLPSALVGGIVRFRVQTTAHGSAELLVVSVTIRVEFLKIRTVLNAFNQLTYPPPCQ